MFHFLSLTVFILGTTSLVTCVNITILHTNDVHARFLSFNQQTKPCLLSDIASKQCWGGAARRMTAIKRIRENYDNVILLDAGDQFQGSRWYTELKWEPVADVMNAMGYTAMAFGNHEFDDGIEGLHPFAVNLSFPVITSNIDSDGTMLKNTYRPYLELNISGERIAIIGYTTTETPTLSQPGPSLKFSDEIDSLTKIVNELKLKGINKIIAVGHSGILTDRRICREVDGIDVVIGGHTHTFLYSGRGPSFENAFGPYPEVYSTNGSTCLVVQDYAYGKYLGFLQVNFDNNGLIDNWNGNPILIDHTFEEDQTIERILQFYQTKLDPIDKIQIGRTMVTLDARTSSCRLHECNVGNIVADSMFYHFLIKNWMNESASEWSSANFVAVNGGSVRGFYAESGTNITVDDLFVISPFASKAELIEIKGKYILEAFEHSVENYNESRKHGKFLQISGARVVYDLSKPNGHRVRSLQVLCNQCQIPKYETVSPNKVYKMITNSFVRNGGDGYSMIQNNVLNSHRSETLDINILLDYIQQHQPLRTGVEGRINFVSNEIYRTWCQLDENA